MKARLFVLSALLGSLAIAGCQQQQSPPVNPDNATPPENPAESDNPPPEDSSTTDPDKGTGEQILEYLITNKDTIKLCQEIPFDAELSRNNSQVNSITEKEFLVTVVCGMVDGQFVHENFLYNDTAGEPQITPLSVSLMTINPQGETNKTTVRMVKGYGQYDPANQTLQITTMFDQLGECGMVGFYQLQGQTFEIQRLLAKPDCTTGYLPPLEYPQVYP